MDTISILYIIGFGVLGTVLSATRSLIYKGPSNTIGHVFVGLVCAVAMFLIYTVL